MKPALEEIYHELYSAFGPQHWWPADSQFEVMVGAILTQNTNWQNVEKAIGNLKKAGSLSSDAIAGMRSSRLAELIRPAGYYNIKAERLKSFVNFYIDEYAGSITGMAEEKTAILREKLLNVKGVGPETADSILLYALERPVFVIDAYTKRILSRHGIMESSGRYDDFQALFHHSLPEDFRIFNEYHALLVKTGKEFCRPKPLCEVCRLSRFQGY